MTDISTMTFGSSMHVSWHDRWITINHGGGEATTLWMDALRQSTVFATLATCTRCQDYRRMAHLRLTTAFLMEPLIADMVWEHLPHRARAIRR
jgi:hypothetical protein